MGKRFLIPSRTRPVETAPCGQTLSKSWTNRARDVKITYKKNAMRNSYISYRVAATKNIAQVALESGNSPAVIQKDYLELVTETEAKRWFSIVPGGGLPS